MKLFGITFGNTTPKPVQSKETFLDSINAYNKWNFSLNTSFTSELISVEIDRGNIYFTFKEKNNMGINPRTGHYWCSSNTMMIPLPSLMDYSKNPTQSLIDFYNTLYAPELKELTNFLQIVEDSL